MYCITRPMNILEINYYSSTNIFIPIILFNNYRIYKEIKRNCYLHPHIGTVPDVMFVLVERHEA